MTIFIVLGFLSRLLSADMLVSCVIFNSLGPYLSFPFLLFYVLFYTRGEFVLIILLNKRRYFEVFSVLNQ